MHFISIVHGFNRLGDSRNDSDLNKAPLADVPLLGAEVLEESRKESVPCSFHVNFVLTF